MEMTNVATPSEPQGTAVAAVEVKAADVVVGMPTYNNVDSIREAVAAVQAACAEYLGSATCTIVHADGGSSDGTVERVAELQTPGVSLVSLTYPLDAVDKLGGPYRGVPAKGNAVRAVFTEARRVGAKVCAVVDVDVAHFAPGWLHGLVSPILERDYDLVAPYYLRPRFGGAINNGVAYPLVRALYGKRVRYPIGGDFACAMRFIDKCLPDPAWQTDEVKSSVDIWLATRAICEGARVGEAMMGVKRQGWKDTGADPSEAVAKVLSALYQGVERWQAVWQKVRGSEPVRMFGGVAAGDESAVTVDVRHGVESFRLGQKNLGEIWQLVLPPRTLLDLHRLAGLDDSVFRIPDELWARLVYDFSAAFHERRLSRDHLLAAFAPLFSGWVASFVSETQTATFAESEERLDRLCLRFEAEKPYLISRWRWPDRFSP